MGETTPIEVVIIGGGQSGLAMSYHLTQRGIEHVILEQERIAESWRSKRWDSFTLVTPNWMNCLPGFAYQGKEPDGFMPRDEVVRYLEAYAAFFNPPIQHDVRVTSVSKKAEHYVVETTTMPPLEAKNVVVATGGFQLPKYPVDVTDVSVDVQHLHSSEYRNPQELKPGNVLVVGSGQSGCQIAEELNQSGRKVYLAISNCGRMPRRYRGHDITWWMSRAGAYDMTIDQMPQARSSCNAHLSATHEINLFQLEEEGIVLLGRLQSIQANILKLASNLEESLAKADQYAALIKQQLDQYIQKSGVQADADEPGKPTWKERGKREPVHQLDMKAHNITTIIWATGYKLDYSWIHVPVFDDLGYPLHRRGVTDSSGLYFLGLNWMHKAKSALLYGIGEDADFLATKITSH